MAVELPMYRTLTNQISAWKFPLVFGKVYGKVWVKNQGKVWGNIQGMIKVLCGFISAHTVETRMVEDDTRTQASMCSS